MGQAAYDREATDRNRATGGRAVADRRRATGGREVTGTRRAADGREAMSRHRTIERNCVAGHNQRNQTNMGLELWDLEKERQHRGNPRPVQSVKRRKAGKRRVYLCRALALAMAVSCMALIYFMTGAIYRTYQDLKDSDKGVVETVTQIVFDKEIEPPVIIQDYIEVNDYSRPGTSLKEIKSIFVHYTANPGTSAAQNRSYFANLAQTHERSASAHFIIGYDGELIQCIPLEEQAYAVMTRNEDSISIECCYLSEDGSFTKETYDTLVHTLAWLVDRYGLSTDDILRHYDCGGKLCPVYYVEHEEAWEKLLLDVEQYERTPLFENS